MWKNNSSKTYNIFIFSVSQKNPIYLYTEDEVPGCMVTQGPGSKKYWLRNNLFQNCFTGVVREVPATDSPGWIDHTWPGCVLQEHL